MEKHLELKQITLRNPYYSYVEFEIIKGVGDIKKDHLFEKIIENIKNFGECKGYKMHYRNEEFQFIKKDEMLKTESEAIADREELSDKIEKDILWYKRHNSHGKTL